MEDDLFEIITDALKQPLSFLIPKQDLISVLDRTSVSLPVEIGADLQQQSSADLEKLFEQLEVYDDEALTELEFPNISLNYRVSDDNRVTKELPFSERERLMISKESINFKMSDSNSAGGSLDTQTRGNSGETGSLFNSREYNGDGYLEEEPSSADVPVANDKLNDEVLVSNSNQTSEISPKHIETNSADSSSDDESLLVSNEDTDTDLLISRDITAASGSPSSIADTSKAFATEQASLKEQQVRRSSISNHPTKRQKVSSLEFIEDFPRIFGETPDGYDISGISRQLEMALSSITLAEIPKVREMLDLEDTRMIIDKLIAFANRLLASNLLHERLIHTQYLVWTELIEQINTIFILYHSLGRLHDFNKKIIFEEDLEILSESVVAVVTSIFNLNLSISRLDNPLSVVSTISNLISIPILFLKAGLNSDWLTVKMQVHLIPFIDRWLKFEDGIKSRTAPIMLSITKVLTQISSQSPTDSEALQEQLVHQLISLTENSSGSYVRPDSYSTIHLCTLNIISCINVPGINNINSDHKDLLRREMYKESYESNTDLLTMYNHLNKSVHNIATSIVKNAMEGNKMPLDIIFSDTVRLIENSSHGIALMFLEAIVSGISKYLHGDKVPSAIETYFVSICGEISYSLFRMDNKQNRSLMSVTASDMKSLSEVSMVLLSGFKNAHEIFKKKSIDYFRLSLIEKVIMIDKRSQSQNVFQTDEMSVDIAPEVLSLYSKLVSSFLNEYEPKVRDIYTDSFQMFARFALDATLNKAFDSILKSFASKRIKTRSKAINCFSRCVSIKPGLLGNEKFQVRLAELLKDGSPMVRDSCIELLNNYLKANPNFWEDFYRPILDCLSDSSIQVKKRVLAIVPSLYEQVLSQGSREYVLFRLLKGLEDDDENIREQVNKTLETLLINNYHESPRDTIDILIETININPKSAQLFELFLQTRVFSKAESKFQKCFVDILSMSIDNVILGVPDNKINGFLHLISIFVRCHGSVLPVQRLESLEPLIMNADNKKDDTLYHTFMILKYTLPSLQVVNDSFLDKILNHILSSLSRYTIKELHEAIPLAYIISKHKKDTIKLANVTISSLRMVYGFIKSLKEHDSLEFNGKLVKLMHILGCIGSYWDLESHRDLFIKADIGFAGKGPVLSLITKYLIHFNDMKVDIRIRRVFTLNLLSICLNHPKLYSHPTIMKHIDDVLNSTSEESIISKKVILQNIYDFIVMQEKESSKANSKVHSSSQSVDMNAFNGTGKEYENDAICSALAQRYASKTLELTYSKDYEFSIVSLKLATVIFGNGYVNPQMCIATFIGLLASDNQVVSTLAFESLKDLFDKHESMFEANYIEGFKNAVLYRYETCVNLFGNSVILKQLYSIISTKLTTRRKFIQALCKIFRIKTSLDLTESEAIFERDLVIFLLINIVNIPFVSLEEILLLYEASSKTLTRQGLDLYDSIKELDNQDAAKKKIACYGSNAGLCIMEFWNFLSTKYGIDIDSVDSSDLEARRAPKVKQNVSFNFRYQDILDDYNDDVKVNNMIMRFTSQISDIDL